MREGFWDEQKAYFDSVDTDGDGSVDGKELAAYLKWARLETYILVRI